MKPSLFRPWPTVGDRPAADLYEAAHCQAFDPSVFPDNLAARDDQIDDQHEKQDQDQSFAARRQRVHLAGERAHPRVGNRRARGLPSASVIAATRSCATCGSRPSARNSLTVCERLRKLEMALRSAWALAG